MSAPGQGRDSEGWGWAELIQPGVNLGTPCGNPAEPDEHGPEQPIIPTPARPEEETAR